MKKHGLVLGLDSSTQSLSAVLVDPIAGSIEYEYAVNYKTDSRLNKYGIDFSSMVIPPREDGEADQPPRMFLASLDAVFSDLKFQGIDLTRIEAINVSAQQHGHVYLNAEADTLLSNLTKTGFVGDLADGLASAFSYPGAPIWKTANTSSEANDIRERLGGQEAVIKASGSNSPLRFTGAVVRRMGLRAPKQYQATKRVLLINSFINAVLSGNAKQACDFGNGAGTSWMNYSKREFDPRLLEAIGKDLPGGTKALSEKLGSICHPLDTVGRISHYFIERYGFSADCAIIAGSGDNPQSKVLFDGDLLSLGTSFVFMSNSTADSRDLSGAANAMYDGLGRPFQFACRTNGALVWDRIRALHKLGSSDFARADEALEATLPGSSLRFWQPDMESFPVSPAFDLTRADKGAADFNLDYAGLVDASLAILWHYSAAFSAPASTEGNPLPLYVTGGPTSSKAIMTRIASLWKRPVQVIGKSGAALGAAVAAYAALLPEAGRLEAADKLSQKFTSGSKQILPDPKLVQAWHKPGILAGLIEAYTNIISQRNKA